MIVTMIMVSVIAFIINLSVFDASMRVQVNYPHIYGLDSNYISFEIKQKEGDTVVSKKLHDLVKDDNVVILFESSDEVSESLGVFDSEYRYVEYPLFFGEFFSKDDFIKGDKSALRLITSESSTSPTSDIKINDVTYKVIGNYTEDYILYNDRNFTIYPLFSNTNINGKFYIACADELQHKIINMFRDNGYDFTVEEEHFNLSVALSYLQNDKQFKMMLFIILLTLISLIITDYAFLNKKQQEYRVHYLVGTRKASLILTEFKIAFIYYIAGIIIASICSYFLMEQIDPISNLHINIYMILMIFMLVVFTALHLLLFTFIQNQNKKES